MHQHLVSDLKLALKPLGAGDLIDRAVRFYTTHPKRELSW